MQFMGNELRSSQANDSVKSVVVDSFVSAAHSLSQLETSSSPSSQALSHGQKQQALSSRLEGLPVSNSATSGHTLRDKVAREIRDVERASIADKIDEVGLHLLRFRIRSP